MDDSCLTQASESGTPPTAVDAIFPHYWVPLKCQCGSISGVFPPSFLVDAPSSAPAFRTSSFRVGLVAAGWRVTPG